MIRRIVAGAVLVATCLLLVASAAVADDRARVLKVYAPQSGETEMKVVIESDEDQAWLGVSIEDLNAKHRQKMGLEGDQMGVLVIGVNEDSPARRAGIEEGDIILSLGSEETSDLDELIDVIDSREPGDEVEISILRDGKRQMLIATLGSKPEELLIKTGPFVAGLEGLKGLAVLGDLALPWFEIGVSSGGRGRLGVYIDDLSNGLADYFEVPDGEGVLVEDIVEDSPAEKAGIKPGDVIVRVGDMAVADRASLVEAISELEADEESPVVVIRKGKEITLVAVVGESEYDKAMKEYEDAIKMRADEISKVRAKALQLDREHQEELKEELEDLKEELEDLKEELREMRED